ncbi:unnamed protein product [Clonostachys rhizophaga]|uniref:Carrier domain-containing protein n=1 Tax=Clonostachys rhizophaga TaxID=160324 RepID=A0A9N9VQL9_9HYPO|nr:unnamed protein product [Clonostachys rhizophaga]
MAGQQLNLVGVKPNSPIAVIVRNAVLSVTGWDLLDDDDAFFDKGLDSRQALQITRALRQGLGRPTLSLSIVYKNPTVKQLSEALAVARQAKSEGNAHLISSLQSTFTSRVKSIPVPTDGKKAVQNPIGVVLTGSTGYLGAYVLKSLLDREDIGHIFCLNRGEDGGKVAQVRKTGDATQLEGRVTFLKVDLASPKLGLNDDVYQNLTRRVSVIIHMAWPVNFIFELQAFRPHLEGVVNLCSLAAALSHQPAKIVFASSIAAVISGKGKNAPESIIDTPPTTNQGYGQSKYISEHILDAAAKHLGISAIVVRVGQIAGPARQKGLWNPTEWFPSLIGSSLHLGSLPDNLGALGKIDWIPSDIFGDVIVDLTTGASEENSGSGAQVFNLRNPKVTPWAGLAPTVLQASSELQGKGLELVSPALWLEELRKSLADLNADGDANKLTAATAKNPGLRLFDFYTRNLWADGIESNLMQVGRATDLSPALQSLPAVHSTWMRKWMEEWMEEWATRNN